MSHGQLPYSPELYEIRTSIVVQNAISTRIGQFSSRRVYYSATPGSGIVVLGAGFTFNGATPDPLGYFPDSTTVLELSYDWHYALVTQEIWANNYPMATRFYVVEVFYNQFTNMEKPHVTRKPETLAAKIQHFGQRIWGSRK